LDRDSFPYETLKSGSLKRGKPAGGAEKGRFKDIDALAHRSNVPLQVFSGETTPILGIESLIVIEGLPQKRYSPQIWQLIYGVNYNAMGQIRR